MKLQHLSIIFVIIILPISLVLSEYIKAQTTLLGKQTEYDGRLISATYDAVKAFQLNTINNSTSNVANSKIRDIEASANTFFNSLSSSYGMAGYGSKTLRSYVPALVYTMYDGYYIYTPFTNKNNLGINNDGETVSGLKPYVYYSCRYIKGNNDIVINYSLDNYIAIQGKIDGKYVNDAGYLIDNIKLNKIAATWGSDSRKLDIETYIYNKCPVGTIYTYHDGIAKHANSNTINVSYVNGVNTTIYETEYMLTQYLPGYGSIPYIKENGTTYYWDKEGKRVFYILNGTEINQATEGSDEYEEYTVRIQYNPSATLYYKEAYDFTNRVRNDYNLDSWVSSKYAYSFKGEPLNLSDNSEAKIFEENDKIPIEYDNSAFNIHRLSVMRNSIETNLATVIASYNKFTQNSYDYQMPKLREDEWDLIMNNICLISFMQGVNTGGNIYSGYAIVPNDNTKEVVQEDDIYIVVGNEYHKINDKDLLGLPASDINTAYGALGINFKRKSSIDNNGNTIFYYPEPALACYNCIVNQSSSIASLKDGGIYEYVNSLSNNILKSKYYQALGRERYCNEKIKYMTLGQDGKPIKDPTYLNVTM